MKPFLCILFLCLHSIFFLPSAYSNVNFKPSLSPTEEKAVYHHGLKIINEKINLKIQGAKSYLLYIQFDKKIRFKITDQRGLDYLKHLSLPETFDSSYFRHSAESRNLQTLYSEIKINFLESTIFRPDGSQQTNTIKNEVENVKMTMENDLYGNYKKFHYSIEDIKVGDEVEIRFNYDVPFRDNELHFLSYRIFFNSTIYKESYELNIAHKDGLNVSVFDHNQAKPDSTFIINRTKVYSWKRKHLKGNLLEECGRPYLSLPYIILSIKPLAYSYSLPDSFNDEFLPTYALYSANKEFKHWSMIRSIDQGLKLRQFVMIDKFIAENSEGIESDTTGYNTLKQLKNTIASDFTYMNDVDFFKGWDERDPRIGTHLLDKKIREISRYEVYIAIIRKLKLNYYTAYLADVRTGILDKEFLKPMDDSDYLLVAFTRDGSPQYIYPKTSNFGLYLNEYPFYFENTYARLIHLSDYMSYREKIKSNLRQATLPNSTFNDNYRRSNALASVDLKQGTIHFKTKVDLSGQYSTMTRGIYKCNYKDLTVNPTYHDKVWEIGDSVTLIDSALQQKNEEYPFNCSLVSNYKSEELIAKTQDTISIDLGDLFKHIIAENIDPKSRTLDFYPDFLGSDSYNYVFKFKQEVKLIHSNTPINIKNDFGEYVFTIDQLSNNSIKVSSYLAVMNGKIEADHIENVSEIFSEVKNLAEKSLSLVVVN